jgi:hypothetical protein
MVLLLPEGRKWKETTSPIKQKSNKMRGECADRYICRWRDNVQVAGHPAWTDYIASVFSLLKENMFL